MQWSNRLSSQPSKPGDVPRWYVPLQIDRHGDDVTQPFITSTLAKPPSQDRDPLTIHWMGRVAVLVVSGDVDMLTAPALADAISHAATESPAAVIVDLANVDFLASAGMTVLVAAHEDLTPTAGFGVVADGPATSRPMRLIGLDRTINLYRTLDDALGDIVETENTGLPA
jgi:anti-sigma B factor antagonist